MNRAIGQAKKKFKNMNIMEFVDHVVEQLVLLETSDNDTEDDTTNNVEGRSGGGGGGGGGGGYTEWKKPNKQRANGGNSLGKSWQTRNNGRREYPQSCKRCYKQNINFLTHDNECDGWHCLSCIKKGKPTHGYDTVGELKEDHKVNCKYWLKFAKEKYGTSEIKNGRYSSKRSDTVNGAFDRDTFDRSSTKTRATKSKKGAPTESEYEAFRRVADFEKIRPPSTHEWKKTLSRNGKSWASDVSNEEESSSEEESSE